jgi:hypothetical protein
VTPLEMEQQAVETVEDNAAKSVEDVKNKMKGLFGK